MVLFRSALAALAPEQRGKVGMLPVPTSPSAPRIHSIVKSLSISRTTLIAVVDNGCRPQFDRNRRPTSAAPKIEVISKQVEGSGTVAARRASTC